VRVYPFPLQVHNPIIIIIITTQITPIAIHFHIATGRSLAAAGGGAVGAGVGGQLRNFESVISAPPKKIYEFLSLTILFFLFSTNQVM
jgi:hypothetical protein